MPVFIKNSAAFLALGQIVLNFLFVVVFLDSIYPKRWFKTVEELEDEKKKAEESWQKAVDFCKVIGEHEAIKLYNESKKQQTQKTDDNG